MLAQRGVLVSYEAVRRWCQKFGERFAQGLRRRRPRPADKWHLDEVFIRIQGELHYLWRAVDQHCVLHFRLDRAQRRAKVDLAVDLAASWSTVFSLEAIVFATT
jgi:putative transposase